MPSTPMGQESARHLPPLVGLVLLGGLSQRMGAAKASQRYHGVQQGLWAFELLRGVCPRVVFSARRSQHFTWLAGRPVIRDRYHNAGPAAGLLSAAATDPDSAWLLLACDMPLVDQDTLRALVSARAAGAGAVAFRHRDGTPEPLCAVYEPAACEVLRRRVAGGGSASLRDLLQGVETRWTAAPDIARLANANDPAERAALVRQLRQLRARRR